MKPRLLLTAFAAAGAAAHARISDNKQGPISVLELETNAASASGGLREPEADAADADRVEGPESDPGAGDVVEWSLRTLPAPLAAQARAWLPTRPLELDITLAIDPHLARLLTPVLLGFSLLVLAAISMVDFGRDKRKEGGGQLRPWSMAGIMALTSYRFYTGFLSATWMPYLLAMEGAQLVESRQSAFMGSAKLIYGLSILLNPMFGLVGDQVAVVSHWSGRRIFVLGGVTVGGLGIYGCVVAAHISSVGWYMAATVLWMLGEAMTDVTTETLVPELLPRSQYEISSAIRSLNFLIGGLSGYSALVILRHLHYSWLYYGYLVVMIFCAFLTLCFMRTGELQAPSANGKRPTEELSMSALVVKAYYVPAHYAGGFPRACLSLFVFSLGSAPMFFLLLMVRDVIGITEQVTQQKHFGVISMMFFIMAAAASLLGAATAASPQAEAHRGLEESAVQPRAMQPTETKEVVEHRWRLMVLSTIAFGAVCIVIPLARLPATVFHRMLSFYVIASCLGLAFGSVYARFQECTWSLLPAGVDVANAMGYAAMCKLAGVGIGNFLAGIILDVYSMSVDGSERVQIPGYVFMCSFCAAVVFAAAGLAESIKRLVLANLRRQEETVQQ